jgi:hypothetical protein
LYDGRPAAAQRPSRAAEPMASRVKSTLSFVLQFAPVVYVLSKYRSSIVEYLSYISDAPFYALAAVIFYKGSIVFPIIVLSVMSWVNASVDALESEYHLLLMIGVLGMRIFKTAIDVWVPKTADANPATMRARQARLQRWEDAGAYPGLSWVQYQHSSHALRAAITIVLLAVKYNRAAVQVSLWSLSTEVLRFNRVLNRDWIRIKVGLEVAALALAIPHLSQPA